MRIWAVFTISLHHFRRNKNCAAAFSGIVNPNDCRLFVFNIEMQMMHNRVVMFQCDIFASHPATVSQYNLKCKCGPVWCAKWFQLVLGVCLFLRSPFHFKLVIKVVNLRTWVHSQNLNKQKQINKTFPQTNCGYDVVTWFHMISMCLSPNSVYIGDWILLRLFLFYFWFTFDGPSRHCVHSS